MHMKKNKKKESQKKFFNATPLYKEYMILDLISKKQKYNTKRIKFAFKCCSFNDKFLFR